MAKRFTDSEKWEDPFFTELTNEYKLVWIYLLDKCDHAGFYKVNIKMLNFCLNSELTEGSILDKFNSRIKVLSPEKWFIPKFIVFQYGDLDDSSRFHKSILKTLKSEGVSTEYRQSIKKVPMGIDTPQDKDKVLDKDKDKNNINNDTNPDKDDTDNDRWLGKSFEQFKKLYPKPVNDCMAFMPFKAHIKTKQDFTDILRALEVYKVDKSVAKGFTKNAENWLGEWRGWLDMAKKPVREIDKYRVSE